MNMDALLEDYMNNPKWAGKIFMQDEKTCYIDGLIAGAKEYEQKFIDMNKTYQDLVNGWVIDYRDLEKENEQLKTQIEKMKCSRNCQTWNEWQCPFARNREKEYVHPNKDDCPCDKWSWQNDRY